MINVNQFTGLMVPHTTPEPEVRYVRDRSTHPLQTWEDYFSEWASNDNFTTLIEPNRLWMLHIRVQYTQPFTGIFGYAVSAQDSRNFLSTWQYMTKDRTGPARLPLQPYRNGIGLRRPPGATMDSFPYLVREENRGDYVVWTNCAWKY